jgi:hypothetical protein
MRLAFLAAVGTPADQPGRQAYGGQRQSFVATHLTNLLVMVSSKSLYTVPQEQANRDSKDSALARRVWGRVWSLDTWCGLSVFFEYAPREKRGLPWHLAPATGKTEAIVAPLVERHLETGAASLPAILVISPTRALVNDLVRRLQEPLAVMGLRVHRRTGDHAVLDRRNPPQVLVTTPESLDSLLVRQTGFLRDVRALMLDELHILAVDR